MIKCKLTIEDAKLPIRANPTDAGADLVSPIDIEILPSSFQKINLGFQIELPQGTVGLIFARSGLGTKNGIVPRNCVGVIDEKYRGDVIVVLENTSNDAFKIIKGDRIAQLVIMPVFTNDFVAVDDLNMTDDRLGGFGSSGK